MALWYIPVNGNPNTLGVSAKRGRVALDTTTMAWWINTSASSGTTWTLMAIAGNSGTASNAGSIVASWDVPPSTVNLTTEGTVDWIWYPQPVTPPFQTTGVHNKIEGSTDLFHGLEQFFTATGTGTTTTTIAGTAFSNTPTDDMNRAGISSVTNYGVIFSTSGSPVNFGWRMNAKVRATQQVFRAYMSIYNATVQLKGTLSQSGVVQTSSITVGTTQTNKVAKLVYSGIPNEELNINIMVTANPANNASLSFAAATIALA